MRRRSCLLEALELFRVLHSGASLGQMIAFLYAAENEGLTLADLAEVTGFYLATASRTIRTFSAPGAEGALPPALGLIEVRPSHRGKRVFLTPAGQMFAARLNRLIDEGVPIQPPCAIESRTARRAEAPSPAVGLPNLDAAPAVLRKPQAGHPS